MKTVAVILAFSFLQMAENMENTAVLAAVSPKKFNTEGHYGNGTSEMEALYHAINNSDVAVQPDGRTGQEQVNNSIANYGSVDQVDREGHNLIWYAVKKDDVELARRLADMGADLDHRYEGDRRTLLHVAVFFNSTNVLRWLVEEKKWNFNVLDRHGWAPLHYAAYNDHVEEVKLLVGYAINMRTSDNKTATGVAKGKSKAYLQSIGGIE